MPLFVQPWITNLRVMWTDGWVMSKCTQDSQKVCTKLLSLPDKAQKTQFLVPQLNYKFALSPRLHPQSDHIINTHTKQVKTLRMGLSWDQFNSSLQAKTHIWPQKQSFWLVDWNWNGPRTTLNHRSLSNVDGWMGNVKVYTRFTKGLYQTAFSTW